jgi:hypothetical protein
MSSLRSETGQVSDTGVIWNAATLPDLEQVQPSGSGQVTFSVKVKNPASKDSSKNLTVSSKVQIKSNEYETYFPGNDLTLKISSPVRIAEDMGYVSGSLPPKVGNLTVYKIKLSLFNSSNDFKDAVLTAFLPADGFDATSVTPSESSNTEFDPATGKLTWKVGALAANTGVFSQPKVLEFNVKLMPSAAQAYQTPVLVKTIQLYGIDSFTAAQVSAKADDLNTASLTGAQYMGKGSVEP